MYVVLKSRSCSSSWICFFKSWILFPLLDLLFLLGVLLLVAFIAPLPLPSGAFLFLIACWCGVTSAGFLPVLFKMLFMWSNLLFPVWWLTALLSLSRFSFNLLSKSDCMLLFLLFHKLWVSAWTSSASWAVLWKREFVRATNSQKRATNSQKWRPSWQKLG